MLIFTAKLSKRKAVAFVLVLAIVLCAIVLIAGLRDQRTGPEAAPTTNAKTNDDRVSYISNFGWEVNADPVEVQDIVIPRDFPEVYAEYNRLQQEQGFDLILYKGLDATRYTYEVLNYPGTSDYVVADLIIYKDEIIAGDVKSTALDGFMHGLQMPSSS